MNQNLTLVRNRTFKFNGSVTNGVAVENLTGATLTLTARWSVGGDEIFTCSSPSDGISITSPTNGTFTVTISATKTSSLPEQEAFLSLPYELKLTTASAETYPLLYGKIIVKPNIV